MILFPCAPLLHHHRSLSRLPRLAIPLSPSTHSILASPSTIRRTFLNPISCLSFPSLASLRNCSGVDVPHDATDTARTSLTPSLVTTEEYPILRFGKLGFHLYPPIFLPSALFLASCAHHPATCWYGSWPREISATLSIGDGLLTSIAYSFFANSIFDLVRYSLLPSFAHLLMRLTDTFCCHSLI